MSAVDELFSTSFSKQDPPPPHLFFNNPSFLDLVHVESKGNDIQEHSPSPLPVLQPHSSTLEYWTKFIVLLAFYSTWATPFELAFSVGSGSNVSTVVSFVEVILDLFFFADVLVIFNTALYIDGVLVTDRKHIRQAYISSWFFIDIVSVLPLELIGPYWKILKLTRFRRLVRYLNDLQIHPWVSTLIQRQVSIHVYGALLIHYFACGWIMFAELGGYGSTPWVLSSEFGSREPLIVYIRSLFWAIALMTRMTLQATPSTSVEEVYTSIMLLSGAVGFAYLFGQYIQSFVDSLATYRNFTQKFLDIRETLKHYDAPPSLLARFAEYETFQKSKLKAQAPEHMFHYLPQPLIQNIKLKVYEQFLQYPCFNGMNPGFCAAVLEIASQRTILPDEFVYIIGELATHVYIVIECEFALIESYDTKALSEDSKFPSTQLGLGCLFGLEGLWNLHRTSSVQNTDPGRHLVSLLQVEIDEFQRLLSLFPQCDAIFRSQLNDNASRGHSYAIGSVESIPNDVLYPKRVQQQTTPVCCHETTNTTFWFRIFSNEFTHYLITLVSVAHLLNFFSTTFRIGYLSPNEPSVLAFSIFTCLDVAIDICLIMSTVYRCYYPTSQPFIVVLSLCSTLPLDWGAMFYFWSVTSISSNYRTIMLLRLTRFLSFPDVPLTFMFGGSKNYNWKACWMAVLYFMTVHGLAAFYFLFAWESGRFGGSWLPPQRLENANPFARFFFSIYYILNQILVLGQGVAPETTGQELYSILILWLHLFFSTMLLGAVSSYMTYTSKRARDYQNRMDHLLQFFKHYHVPKPLQKQALKYLFYTWDASRGKDPNKLIKALPLFLRKKFLLFLCRESILKYSLFEHATALEMELLFESLRIIFIPKDEFIFHQGDISGDMYYIIKGQVKLISAVPCDGQTQGKLNLHWTVTYLGPSHVFGDELARNDAFREFTTRTTQSCHLLRISKSALDIRNSK